MFILEGCGELKNAAGLGLGGGGGVGGLEAEAAEG